MILDGVSARLKREHNSRAWHAWHVAALSRAKKMPPLSRMLHRAQAKRRQTWQQQKMMAKALNAAFGGTVITRDRKG